MPSNVHGCAARAVVAPCPLSASAPHIHPITTRPPLTTPLPPPRSRPGEALDLLARALGIPAARLTAWREACLNAGQEALKKQPLDSRDHAPGHLALHWEAAWPGAGCR